MKPCVFPYTCKPRWLATDAPSELLMRESKASAAASQILASSMAWSAERLQGCDRSKSGGDEAMRSASASPEQASSAVNRAMLQALATVSRPAWGEKSAVPAEPLRLSK